MLWIFSEFYNLVCYCLIDFVIFIFVDVFVKLQLKDASNEEKRRIWLVESACLLVICFLCYFHHIPYLLGPLTAVTFAYTQLCGRVDLRQLWNGVQTRWDEYKQHEESMGHIREQLLRQRQANTLPPPNVNYPHFYQQVSPGSVLQPLTNNSNYSVSPKPIHSNSGWFFSLPGKSIGERGPKIDHLIPDQRQHEGMFVSQKHARGMLVRNPEENFHQTLTKPLGFGGERLTRRPLRQENTTAITHISKPQSLLPSASVAASSKPSIKTKFMTAFGMNAPTNLPPGLRNNGMNLCFMNAVLQSLARTPHLVSCLMVDSRRDELQCGVAESVLLSTLAEVLHQCSLPPGQSSVGVLDPTSFRQAASTLNSSLFAPMGKLQDQQDAAEFLMWLLDKVHTVLNNNKKARQNDKVSRQRGEEGFPTSTFSVLKFIYGDLNHTHLKDLKDACRKEIKSANGLENDSYAEPIQRLSDLEWLTHKQNNESIIDDLFTGQLVEAYHCLSNNNISVNLQAFNVLPVPIAAPRELSGVGYLEDCFTTFCHIEHVFGHNGILRDQAEDTATVNKKRKRTINPVDQSTPKMRMLTRSSKSSLTADTTLLNQFMSPIPSAPDIDDSGFHDHLFKTSTPVLDATTTGVGNIVNRQQGEIERRCLLRQLPECLIIQLMRFSFNQQVGKTRKIKNPVSIRLKGLDLTHIIYDSVTQREDLTAASHTYDLYSLCVHLGAESMHNGHYVSYALHGDGNWYRFDDEKVAQVNMDYEVTTKELRENAYILFYKRA
ncbi:uncharacterized protein LOC121368834 [Gigantopelta aegis]|uniref:uncharacterized protein LOC121368834 n=1 Tax=Gigantopelta aegis TaxID=1735272 RepID=UPI001B887407|nr:uncharacterized protein LOC121368834 [Gigantopelta aegis]